MMLNDIFMLPSSRPDLEVCTKFGTPGVFAGPKTCVLRVARLELDRRFLIPCASYLRLGLERGEWVPFVLSFKRF